MGIPKCLDFEDYNNYPNEANPTTDGDMQNYLSNQNALMNTLSKFLWQPSTDYTVGQIILSDSMGAGVVGVCIVAGKTGVTEPTWTSVSTTVTSGTARFLMSGLPTGVTVTGTGNVIVDASVDNGKLTLTKGGTFIKGVSKGSATKPVYVDSNGNAVACTYTLAQNVTATSKLTDTVTTLSTNGSGNAITNITASNGALTVTKGANFSLDGHTHAYLPADSGYAGSNVAGGMCTQGLQVAICSTAKGTRAKVASLDGFVFREGACIPLYVSNGNTTTSTNTNKVTLNVNNTGAKEIDLDVYDGAFFCFVYYNGTKWIRNTYSTYYGPNYDIGGGE